jgi:hypothetical protein
MYNKKTKSIMKQFIISFIGVALLFSACIKDDGNYDYIAPEEPVVKLEKVYNAYVGETLLIEPQITFSNSGSLSLEWTIIDGDAMTEYVYKEDKLDIRFGLKAKLYSARLTVTDQNNGMKYFYPFFIQGHTGFTQGTVILTSAGNQAQLVFVKPDGTVQDNLYEIINRESLPPHPTQIVPIQHQNYIGKPYLGYWLISADTDNPGVELNVDDMSRIRYFRENFFTEPEGSLAAGPFIPRDDATMCGIINSKFYVGAFSTYYLAPVYGLFGTYVPGNYELAPVLAVGADGTFFWSYDALRKSLVCFIPPAGMFFDATSMPGPPPAFDPSNIGLDAIHLAASNSAFFFFGKDASNDVFELKFSTGGQMVISQYKRTFAHPEILKDDSKWTMLKGQEIFYISSRNKVYRYNPVNESLEEVAASFSGTVSMVKVLDSNTLLVGEEGKLHFLDISIGKNGEISRSISGFAGQPADVYIREIVEE